MTTSLEADAAAARSRLVAQLVSEGALPDVAWQRAFEVVPRHTLVPTFYAQPDYRVVNGSVPGDAEEWLAAVYSDTTPITAMMPGEVCSSSTMPSLVAHMLYLLDVQDGHRVLQVGTGTGYTAALLSERLGSDAVTSIDVDPELTALAARRLVTMGYRPTITTGDGSRGDPDSAPYDRIMATFALRRIPPAWLTQTVPGGRIVAPIRSGLAIIQPASVSEATGRFDQQAVSFMPMRTVDSVSAAEPVRDGAVAGEQRPVVHGVRGTYYQRDFRFLLDLAMPDLTTSSHGSKLEDLILSTPDGSTARLDTLSDQQAVVSQSGPRNLWDHIEQLHEQWRTLGEPSRYRYGITIQGDRQTVWLDQPDSGVTYEI